MGLALKSLLGRTSQKKPPCRNHMRQHTKKEKSLSRRTCTLCPYETRVKSNLNRHTAQKKESQKHQRLVLSVENCYHFRKKSTRHKNKKNQQTKDSPTSPKVVQKVKSSIGFGTFVRTEKESTTQELLLRPSWPTYQAFRKLFQY